MQNLLKKLQKKYNLKVGEIEFSPIMQCSIGLSMLYTEEVEKGCTTPFHLNYPDKHNAALWLSVALLRNFFLEDYINQAENRIKELNLQPGDIIEIFGANAEFLENGEDKFCVEFKNGAKCYIPNKSMQYVNKDPDKKLNKYSYYKEKKKELREKRNAISKIIEPNDDILINEKALTSHVLVVAGRGNTGSFKQYLKRENIFGRALSDVFSVDDKLRIHPDLESLKFITEKSNNGSFFERAFLQYSDDLIESFPDKETEIKKLEKAVTDQKYRTQDFINRYDSILEEINPDNNERIFNIREAFPGVQQSLPENLRAVVLNDFNQVNIYKSTIGELVKRDIPVFVLSNRYVENRKDFSLFGDYFSKNNSDLRINWTRSKISELIDNQKQRKDFLDKKLWESCLRFARQKISIYQSKSHPLDSLVKQIQDRITDLQGQEKLKKAYWKFFNPLIYSFKNGETWREYHEGLISEFEMILNHVKETIRSDLNKLFADAIEVIQMTKDNFKNLTQFNNIFVQAFAFRGEECVFPIYNEKIDRIRNINFDTDDITFTGFPLDEPIGKYIVQSMSEYFVPNIKIVCWPTEGELTYNYLRRRLKASHFYDNLPRKWQIDEKFVVRNENDINDELDSVLTFLGDKKVKIDETLDDEVELKEISNFKYSEYKKQNRSTDDYIVTCNIVDFEDNLFMFLPKDSRILARIETNGEETQVDEVRFDALNVGNEVFDYQMPKHGLRELTKDVEGSKKVYDTLEIWKKSLRNTYKRCGKDIDKLTNTLQGINQENQIGANPSRQNVKRWLFDEDMLSPFKKNLKVILLADSDESLVSKVPDIIEAYKNGKKLSSQVSEQIKSTIIKKLETLNSPNEKSFTIKLQGYNIGVKYRRIINLQESDIKVRYSQTRKFVD